MMPHFEHVIGFDPNGIRRIYASTWIEARQEARNHIRNHPYTAPLSQGRLDLDKCLAKWRGVLVGSPCLVLAGDAGACRGRWLPWRCVSGRRGSMDRC